MPKDNLECYAEHFTDLMLSDLRTFYIGYFCPKIRDFWSAHNLATLIAVGMLNVPALTLSQLLAAKKDLT